MQAQIMIVVTMLHHKLDDIMDIVDKEPAVDISSNTRG